MVVFNDTQSLNDFYYDAEALFQQNNYTEAEIAFQNFVKKGYNQAPAYYRLACIQKAKGNVSEAEGYLNKAISLDPGNTYYTLYQASNYEATGEYRKAAAIYHRLARVAPPKWSLFREALRLYRNVSDMDSQLAVCRNWEAAFGLREDIAKSYVYAYNNRKLFDSSIAVYKRLIARYPDRRQYRMELAQTLQSCGRNDEAIQIYESLLEEDPANSDLIGAMCQYNTKTGNAAALWKQVKQLSGSTLLPISLKLECVNPLLQPSPKNIYFDSLEPILVSACAAGPQEPKTWFYLGNWYYTKYRWKQTIPAFSRYVNLVPSDFSSWTKYSEALESLHLYERLQKVTDSMIEVFPSNPHLYLRLSRAYFETGKYKLAQEATSGGLSFAVDNDIKKLLNLQLARILNQLNKAEESNKVLEAISSQFPNDPDVLEMKSRMLLDNGKTREAMEMLLSCEEVAKPEKKKDLMVLKGRIFTAQKAHLEAVKLLAGAIDSYPERPEIWEILAINYAALNDKTNANDAWKAACEIGFASSATQIHCK